MLLKDALSAGLKVKRGTIHELNFAGCWSLLGFCASPGEVDLMAERWMSVYYFIRNVHEESLNTP